MTAHIKKHLLSGLVALLFVVTPAYAETVTVGYLEGFGIVEDLSSLDNKGYGHDVLEAAERYSNLEFEYVPVTQDTVLSSLNSGTIDLFGPMSYSEAYAVNYEFTKSFGTQQIMLVAPANSAFLFDDTAAFQSTTVAVMDTLGYTPYLDFYSSMKNINFTYDNVNNFDDYYNSTADLTLAGSLLDVQNRKNVANLGLEPLYFVAKKNNRSLVTAVDTALSSLELNDPHFFNDTQRKYFSTGTLSEPVLTVEQTELLRQKSNFTVGYLSNHFPVEGIGDSGRAEGIAVDIMTLVAAEAGIALTFEPYSITDNIDHNRFDINISWAAYQDFNEIYNATNPFSTSNPLILIAKEGITDPYSMVSRIGTLPFVTFDSSDLNATYPMSTFSTYNSYHDLAKALDAGEVDGALLSNVASDYVLNELGDSGYSLYGTTHAFPIRLFINKSLGDEYLDIFNALIQRVDDTEVEKAFLSQISKYRAEPTLLELVLRYWYIYAFGIAFVTGGFFALYLFLQRKKQLAVLDALNIDEITGLPSEMSFIRDVEQILKTAEPNQFLIITFDIDHFNLIRKQYGYDRSNDVLKKIGETLVKNYPTGSIVARSKADLFLIFTKQSATGRNINNENVMDCAQGLLASTHPLSVSEGLYRIQDTTMAVQLMIDYSNMARLQGKSVYGLTLNEYTKELDEKRELNNSIVLRMERALLGKELIPYYQPKVHLKTSMINGCEALVRWCDIDSDLDVPKVKYMPDEFIPLFEENGFIAKLDYHIFDEICAFIRRNIKKADVPKISINLSGVTLLKNDLRSTLLDTLERYRIMPRDIDLEITESAFTQYPKESASKVRVLRKVGFTISMDDFGTGASSLNRLKDMDITTIKLDKAFLDYNLAELKGSVIIGNMINMARRLGLEVVAEGVETKEQLSALKMLHCDLVQGYYYSRPVNEDTFIEMLQEPVCLSDVERIKRRKEDEEKAKKAAAAELIP